MDGCKAIWILAITFIFSFLSFKVSAIKITGATSGLDPSSLIRPFRYEINDFAQSGPAWDIFILALQRFQSDSQNHTLSYFQVAGIHGYPVIPWDGVIGTNGNNYPGYCMHASVAFPTWHRPYLALFEQMISNYAQLIARMFPLETQNVYIDAASTLRIPYWDWAINPSLPDVITTETLPIHTPEGLQNITNPLLQYNFQSDASGNGFPSEHPASGFATTVRHYDYTNGQSNQIAASTAMLATAASVLSLVYQLFSTNTDYSSFSCTWPGGKTNVANNVENIHNLIHNNIGGLPGHMTYPEVAAFDPVFWLHHANVDRIFAMWQALNPTAYITPTINAYGSYYEAANTVDAGNTTLAPFHSDNGTSMYSSDAVRSTAAFGYTYPELVDWDISAEDLASTVRSRINELYNPEPSTTSNQSVHRLVKRFENVAEAFGNVCIDTAMNLGVNNLNTQWSIRLRLDRFAADQTFEIHFFIGEPPKTIDTWSSATNLIGSHAQFIAANVKAAHPQGPPKGGLQGEISISHTLAAGVHRGYLRDMSAHSVVPILTEQLRWRARLSNGSEIDVHHLSGLSITVLSRRVQPRTTMEEFPIYGAIEEHPEITAGKTGRSL